MSTELFGNHYSIAEEAKAYSYIAVAFTLFCINSAAFVMDCLGEANTAYNRDLYRCTFPAMITDWRQKWYIGTDAHTQLFFPFGFVQVDPMCVCGVAELCSDLTII